jgi:hypothetical protein
MTEGGVRAVVKEVLVKAGDGDQPGDKSDEYYTPFLIRGVEIGRYRFDVRFLFDGKTKTLSWVQLNVDNHASRVRTANGIDTIFTDMQEANRSDNIFTDMDRMLVEKYGRSTRKDSPGASRDDVHEERTWVFPSTIVELFYLRIGGDTLGLEKTFPHVLISYKNPASTKNVDKL